VACAGGKAVMTRIDHPSGSDRVFEALGAVDAAGVHDVVVNIRAIYQQSNVRSRAPASRRWPKPP
jgi:CMP-2-keto-3-deoxyoctulosonic acid synthetase